MASKLSDKAIAVFAFAAYHEMSSGETVVDVVLKDGAGHAADPAAIQELEAAGLATTEGERAVFTDGSPRRRLNGAATTVNGAPASFHQRAARDVPLAAATRSVRLGT